MGIGRVDKNFQQEAFQISCFFFWGKSLFSDNKVSEAVAIFSQPGHYPPSSSATIRDRSLPCPSCNSSLFPTFSLSSLRFYLKKKKKKNKIGNTSTLFCFDTQTPVQIRFSLFRPLVVFSDD
jgi:hypothetical protein